MTVTKSKPRLRHEGAEPMTLGSCSHQVTTQLPPSVLQSCPLVLSLLVFTVFFYFLIFYYNASLFEELNLVSVLSALFTFSYSLFTFFSASHLLCFLFLAFVVLMFFFSFEASAPNDSNERCYVEGFYSNFSGYIIWPHLCLGFSMRRFNYLILRYLPPTTISLLASFVVVILLKLWNSLLYVCQRNM